MLLCLGLLLSIDGWAKSVSKQQKNFPDPIFLQWINEYMQIEPTESFTKEDAALKEDNLFLGKGRTQEPASCIFNGPGGIKSFKGIEYFTKLKHFVIVGHLLPKLDLSKNVNLQFVNCSGNEIEEIILPKSQSVLDFRCRNNLISSLDLSSIPNAHEIRCWKNQLEIIDLSSLPKLRNLSSGKNLLTSINLNHNKELTYIRIEDNQLQALDLGTNTKIKNIYAPNNAIKNITLPKSNEIYTINLSNNKITSLQPFLDCPNLRTLDVRNNPISENEKGNIQILEKKLGPPEYNRDGIYLSTGFAY